MSLYSSLFIAIAQVAYYQHTQWLSYHIMDIISILTLYMHR
jgi:hypothetical protein